MLAESGLWNGSKVCGLCVRQYMVFNCGMLGVHEGETHIVRFGNLRPFMPKRMSTMSSDPFLFGQDTSKILTEGIFGDGNSFDPTIYLPM